MHGGNHLVQVAVQAEMSDIVDRCGGVRVNGDDMLAVAHPCQMVTGARDAASDVQVRPHRAPGLAHLPLMGGPPQINGYA